MKPYLKSKAWWFLLLRFRDVLNSWFILYFKSSIRWEKLKWLKILVTTLICTLFFIWCIQRFIISIFSCDLVIYHITRHHSLCPFFHFVVILQAFWIRRVIIVIEVESKIISCSFPLGVQILIILTLLIISVNCLISGLYDSSI
jgi:hypothetical protein